MSCKRASPPWSDPRSCVTREAQSPRLTSYENRKVGYKGEGFQREPRAAAFCSPGQVAPSRLARAMILREDTKVNLSPLSEKRGMKAVPANP
jgi:hypothetical protein